MENDEKTADLEQQDTQTQEETQDETQETHQDDSESKEEEKDWKAEALKYKAILDRNKNKAPEQKASKKSDELDYGQKAFLASNGVKGSKEIDFVKAEMKKSGEELDSLLENEYFQSKLEKFRALNKTADATIRGKDSKGITTDSVEYWAQKPIEDVPMDMRRAVVNHKLKQSQNKGKFYNQ